MASPCWRAACAPLLTLLLAACAVSVPVSPTQLAPLGVPSPDVVVASAVSLQLSTGYTRTLPAGSRWRAVGTVPQGTVYRPIDIVFAIEGRQVHEAYLVLRGAALQGFYLPAEGNFSSFAPALSLPLQEGAHR